MKELIALTLYVLVPIVLPLPYLIIGAVLKKKYQQAIYFLLLCIPLFINYEAFSRFYWWLLLGDSTKGFTTSHSTLCIPDYGGSGYAFILIYALSGILMGWLIRKLTKRYIKILTVIFLPMLMFFILIVPVTKLVEKIDYCSYPLTGYVCLIEKINLCQILGID